MPLGYRSIFTVSGGENATEVAASQFRPWLRHKELDGDATTPGLHEVGDQARLVVTEVHPHDGSRLVRYRLTESRPEGDWITTLTARDSTRELGWIWLDITAPTFERAAGAAIEKDQSATAEPRWTAVPGLVRNILGAVDACDGELVLADRPRLVRADDFEELVDTICDPVRRGAAIVAAPVPDVPMPVLLEHVDGLTRQSVGLAGAYVLDHESAARLTESFGPLHAVPLGALRTYLPGADPASVIDARRHRIMLARTIATKPVGKLARTLGWASRSRSMTLPLPNHVLRADRLLSREEPATVLRSLHPRPGASPATEGAVESVVAPTTSPAESAVVWEATEIAAQAAKAAESADLEAARAGHASVQETAAASVQDVTAALEPVAKLIRELAGEVAADESAALTAADLVSRLRQLMAKGTQALRGQAEMSRRVSEVQDALEEVEDERDQARVRLEEEQFDHAETQEELHRLRFEAGQLRAALAAAAAPAEAWVLDEPPQPPGSFEDLLARLDDGALPGVAFTGDPGNAIDLDSYDPLGTWAAKTWEMLQAVSGYIQARQAGEFRGGLHAYLMETPPGRPGYSAGAHAAHESESVEQSGKLRAARELPVPPAVCPVGKVFMGAHFKVAKKGMISPRMHYFDDTASSGKVYVGYIGRHLPNTLTN